MDELVTGTGRGSGDLLQFRWFNLHLDPNSEEIPDPMWEIKNFHCISQYEVSFSQYLDFSSELLSLNYPYWEIQ